MITKSDNRGNRIVLTEKVNEQGRLIGYFYEFIKLITFFYLTFRRLPRKISEDNGKGVPAG